METERQKVNPDKEHTLQAWKKLRQRARMDLLFLCNEILGYKDVHQHVHGPIIERLQKFQGGVDEVKNDGQIINYTPAVPIYSLEGSRRRLFLDPRGFLKTTLITIAHTIQWIINYPNVRLIIFHAKNEIVHQMLGEIRSHFQFNNRFRWLFVDHCPPLKRIGDFGNMTQFTTMARRSRTLREPTVFVSSIDSIIAGMHCDIIKCSDIVDKENVRTPEAIQQVNSSFSQIQFLLDEPFRAWIDVEGTCYDFSDCYNRIMDSEQKKEERERIWSIHRRAIMDEDGKPVWEKPVSGRTKCFDKAAINAVRNDPTMDTYTFMAQYFNTCIVTADAFFDPKTFQWVATDRIKAISRRYHATVDLASVNPLTGVRGTEDFSVLLVAGYDQMNRGYVCDLSRGRYKPGEVIDELFRLYDRWNCDFRIEDASGARQILHFLQREMGKRKKWPCISLIKRDTRVSKQERIAGLQPWIRSGDLRFAEELPWKEELIMELTRFPRYNHDDIADALADQLQNRTYFGSMKTEQEELHEDLNRNLPWFMREPMEVSTVASGVDKMTGI